MLSRQTGTHVMVQMNILSEILKLMEAVKSMVGTFLRASGSIHQKPLDNRKKQLSSKSEILVKIYFKTLYRLEQNVQHLYFG